MSDAPSGRRDTGPGILETTLVFGLAVVLALVIVTYFSGPLAVLIDVVADAAHAGR
jgi:hypothetical protein